MTTPLILVFVADLFFSTRIESVIERLGFDCKLIEHADQIGPDTLAPPRQLAEHLVGRTGMLTEKVIRWRPGLIIFDLNNRDIPWREWIALLKSTPATRRIPVLAFGAHMDVETMTTAREAGADAVLARSRFTSDMPNLIRKHLRVPDVAAIQAACRESLSERAREGIRLFNAGEYFEAHELLEDAWNEDETPGKELYRAILQIAVAYLQIERGNYRGARKMFLRVRQWIEPLPDVCRGVDVRGLWMDAQRVEAELRALGPEGIGRFDRGLFKPVRIVEA